ncbi:hypothetical protein NE237_031422 [Protea cynaroides]|uniref:Zinc knuckle CX2CX4HX4C domain-containing protein n=1 Tax=Protea cynaroides TaxID=273540 RepID=A0A9Q0L1K2_9MAGN|nr:hypothetical protein NE237_031422 [Protea cynaroides]
MREAPWTVSGNLIILEHWNDQHSWTFDKVEFWVHLHNIPSELFDENMAPKLISFLRNVIQLIDGINQGQKTQFIRARTYIDICNPLRTCFNVKRKNGMEHMIKLKYERLPLYCFFCGIIGHDHFKCNLCFEFENPHRKEHRCSPSEEYLLLFERHYADLKALVTSQRLMEKAKVIKRDLAHSSSSSSTNRSTTAGNTIGENNDQSPSKVTPQIPVNMPARHPPIPVQVIL